MPSKLRLAHTRYHPTGGSIELSDGMGGTCVLISSDTASKASLRRRALKRLHSLIDAIKKEDEETSLLEEVNKHG